MPQHADSSSREIYMTLPRGCFFVSLQQSANIWQAASLVKMRREFTISDQDEYMRRRIVMWLIMILLVFTFCRYMSLNSCQVRKLANLVILLSKKCFTPELISLIRYSVGMAAVTFVRLLRRLRTRYICCCA